jgi:hypothetical protein
MSRSFGFDPSTGRQGTSLPVPRHIDGTPRQGASTPRGTPSPRRAEATTRSSGPDYAPISGISSPISIALLAGVSSSASSI